MTLRVGVTGSRGFIGRHLIEALQSAQIGEIHEFASRLEEDEKVFNFVSHCDVIVHLAGVNRAEPEKIVRENVSGCFRILTAAMQKKWILFVSTMQVGTPYAWSKLACEDMLLAAAQAGKIFATVLRLPNIYGPNCKPHYNSVIATFCHLVAEGKKFSDLPIHGDGSDLREYLYVGELVRRMVSLIQVGAPGHYVCETLTGETLSARQIGEILTKPDNLKEFPYLEHTLATYQARTEGS